MFGPCKGKQSDQVPSLEISACSKHGGDLLSGESCLQCFTSLPQSHPPLFFFFFLKCVHIPHAPMPVCFRPQLSSPFWSVWWHVTLPRAMRDACSHLKLKAERSLTDLSPVRLSLGEKRETLLDEGLTEAVILSSHSNDKKKRKYFPQAFGQEVF